MELCQRGLPPHVSIIRVWTSTSYAAWIKSLSLLCSTYLKSFVCAFLTSKSQETYEEMLTAILDKAEELNIVMDPTTVVTVFEHAAMNAVNTTLGPHIVQRGCFFHLAQSTWRKI
ncbi:uncharacterized protein LOC143019515 [Oratosquilla oratoria]|uniref:uncharacterized protein LOC143019515 n=1 Tax=Oratosquilla oratoria TaxID=337810 RepID=UPI003F768EEF